MVDRFGRDITYLRISVTDACNLRCRYCPPAVTRCRREMLSFDEITEVARAAARMGVRKMRVTGGEPLMRRNVDALVSLLARIDGVEDLAMSTNGILLADHAHALASAGLHRVNVSLDTVNADTYRRITGGGDIRRVFAGIEAARTAGLGPIKLNCVVNSSSSEPDAREVARFAKENGFEVRFIRRMDFTTGTFSIVEGGSGGDCRRCNRLRLSCDGQIRPCLFSDAGFSIREFGVSPALEQAILCKPEKGAPCRESWIRAIGG